MERTHRIPAEAGPFRFVGRRRRRRGDDARSVRNESQANLQHRTRRRVQVFRRAAAVQPSEDTRCTVWESIAHRRGAAPRPATPPRARGGRGSSAAVRTTVRHAVRTLHTGEKMKPTPEFSPKNPVDGSRASVSTGIQAAAGGSAQAPGAAADDGAPLQRCPC